MLPYHLPLTSTSLMPPSTPKPDAAFASYRRLLPRRRPPIISAGATPDPDLTSVSSETLDSPSPINDFPAIIVLAGGETSPQGEGFRVGCYPMPKDDGWQKLSPLSDDDVSGCGKVDIGIGIAGGRHSFSYYRLPDPLLRLSVRKLDGSSFDVQIPRTAHVWEMKVAVENVFMQTHKEGGIHISWSHVWSHFCLSYSGEKLLDDAVSLRSLRIKDGDHLCFDRHHSLNISPINRVPRYHGVKPEKRHRRTMTAPEFLRRVEVTDTNKTIAKDDESQSSDEKSLIPEKKGNFAGHKEFRLSHFLLGWLSCVGDRARSEARTLRTSSGGSSESSQRRDS